MAITLRPCAFSYNEIKFPLFFTGVKEHWTHMWCKHKSFKCFKRIYEPNNDSDPPLYFVPIFGFPPQVSDQWGKRQLSCGFLSTFSFVANSTVATHAQVLQFLTPKWHCAAQLLLVNPSLWLHSHLGAVKFTVSHRRYHNGSWHAK